ncbi:hypothetical protein [Haladaptatus sp. NG-SE-30]
MDPILETNEFLQYRCLRKPPVAQLARQARATLSLVAANEREWRPRCAPRHSVPAVLASPCFAETTGPFQSTQTVPLQPPHLVLPNLLPPLAPLVPVVPRAGTPAGRAVARHRDGRPTSR